MLQGTKCYKLTRLNQLPSGMVGQGVNPLNKNKIFLFIGFYIYGSFQHAQHFDSLNVLK